MDNHLFQSTDRPSRPPAKVHVSRVRKRGRRWLCLDANRSTSEVPHLSHRDQKTVGWRDHYETNSYSQERVSAKGVMALEM